MVNIGKSYNTATDVPAPQLTQADLVHAVKVVCGLAWNADDAKFLLAALGVDRETLIEARSDYGRELGLV